MYLCQGCTSACQLLNAAPVPHLSWSRCSHIRPDPRPFLLLFLGHAPVASKLASQRFLFCYEEAHFISCWFVLFLSLLLGKDFFLSQMKKGEKRTGRTSLFPHFPPSFSFVCQWFMCGEGLWVGVAFPRLHLRFCIFLSASALRKCNINV